MPKSCAARRRRRRRARRRCALSARAQAAIVAWAGRVTRLTEARADELAEIAVPVVVPRAMGGDRVAALVGVAHWLLGRR